MPNFSQSLVEIQGLLGGIPIERNEFKAFAQINSLLSSYKELLPALRILEAKMARQYEKRGEGLALEKLIRVKQLKTRIDEEKDRIIEKSGEKYDFDDFLEWAEEPSVQKVISVYRKKGKKDKAERLLTQVLAVSEREAGLNSLMKQAGRSNSGAGLAGSLFLSLIENKKFADELKIGPSWKDVGAGPNHGEYTHRIQWFCIFKTLNNLDGAGLFTTLATLQTQLPAGQTLWDHVFDRGVVGSADDDCRCPEKFNRRLMEDRTLPTLSAWLRATCLKRELQGIPDAGSVGEGYTGLETYWASKKSNLTSKQRDQTRAINRFKE